jgi:hypothetical protein
VRDLGDGTYRCPDCELVVGTDELVPDASKTCGHGAYCRTCQSRRSAAYAASGKGKAARERYETSEKGRLAIGRCTQRSYLSGGAGRYFSTAFD